jgi:hypothetical protein
MDEMPMNWAALVSAIFAALAVFLVGVVYLAPNTIDTEPPGLSHCGDWNWCIIAILQTSVGDPLIIYLVDRPIAAKDAGKGNL